MPTDGRRYIIQCEAACEVMIVTYTGVRLEKDVEAEEEAEADERERSNGLWNAQPFRPPPAAPLPECPAGCARAQPIQVTIVWASGKYRNQDVCASCCRCIQRSVRLQEWQRASHGTGMGCSSTAGFWIPDKAPQLLLPLASVHSSSKKAGVVSAVMREPLKHVAPLPNASTHGRCVLTCCTLPRLRGRRTAPGQPGRCGRRPSHGSSGPRTARAPPRTAAATRMSRRLRC